MISLDDKNIILAIAKKYQIKSLFLLKKLSKSVDLVDLSENSLFNRLIEKKSIKIYG